MSTIVKKYRAFGVVGVFAFCFAAGAVVSPSASLAQQEDAGIKELLDEVNPPPMPAPEAQAPVVEASDEVVETTQETQEITMPDIPEAAESEEFDENLFFDAEALVPRGEVARKGAPSKVDPVLNPGSRLVVVRTKHEAGSKESQLVAADRAMKLGRHESALSIYDGLYARNKRDPNILMGRAVALQRIGSNEEAMQAYEDLLDIRPRNLEARINLYGLLSKRYPAVALRNLMEWNEENPGRASIAAQIAVVQAQLGQYQDAIRYLGAAASMEPEQAGHVFNMAVIADRAGEKKQAIQYYEEALELDTLYGAGRSIPRESVFQRLAELR